MRLQTLLSVEDSDAEFFLVETAMHECRTPLRLLRAADGEEAVQILGDAAERADDLPNLILLDINMPKKDGFEVLEFIRQQEFLMTVPVVMFSSSTDPRDRKRALASGADDFISKPSELDAMIDVISEICTRYLLKSGSPEGPE